MIDYDKLRVAMTLSAEYAKQTQELQRICVGFNSSGDIVYDIYGSSEIYHNIDSLIAKLTELTQPKAKYAKGQIAWAYSHGVMQDWLIDTIYWEPELNDYRVDARAPNADKRKASLVSSQLYALKQELIEAQIEYWTKLKIDEISASKTCPKCGMQRVADGMCWNIDCEYKECQHESDGHRYDTRKLLMNYAPIDKTWQELLEIGCHNKCLKCGEFYR
jgi:hypothetical protein